MCCDKVNILWKQENHLSSSRIKYYWDVMYKKCQVKFRCIQSKELSSVMTLMGAGGGGV